MVFSRKKFPLQVVIFILQAFNCRYLEIFVHDLYFFTLYFKAKTQRNKSMSDFYSGNSVNCVLLDINRFLPPTAMKSGWQVSHIKQFIGR